MIVKVGKLKGPFRGFRNLETRFTFVDGSVWRQNEPRYLYFYANMPRARVVYENGRYILEVDGTDETIEVTEEPAPYASIRRTRRVIRAV